MAFAEHARKGGAGLRVFPRSTETYRPRRKNIMDSIFRQNVFAKNNVLQITYISPRLPQRFVLFCFFFVSPQRVYPFWNSNSKQIPFWEFKFHCRNMSRVSGTHVTVNAIKCHFLECRATRVLGHGGVADDGRRSACSLRVEIGGVAALRARRKEKYAGVAPPTRNRPRRKLNYRPGLLITDH